jgi:hypothetical protein
MHRSGTSAIAGLLHLLGLEFGREEDLMAADERNRKGYWESSRLANYQELVLRRLGGAWDTPPDLSPGWERTWRLTREVGRARREFRQIYPSMETWTWKDPRTVLLLPFWQRALKMSPVVVAAYRHPLEVADSLASRDEFSKRSSLALWEAYNRALLTNARGMPTILVSYEALVARTLATTDRLVEFLGRLGIVVRRPPDDVLEDFIDGDLRHAAYDRERLEHDQDVTDGQRQLLDALEQLEGSHTALPAVG